MLDARKRHYIYECSRSRYLWFYDPNTLNDFHLTIKKITWKRSLWSDKVTYCLHCYLWCTIKSHRIFQIVHSQSSPSGQVLCHPHPSRSCNLKQVVATSCWTMKSHRDSHEYCILLYFWSHSIRSLLYNILISVEKQEVFIIFTNILL